MIRTTDPGKMKTEISKLKASGGGDIPEMCLSGLQVLQWTLTFLTQNGKSTVPDLETLFSQLALTGAPSSSHIYVFTDAIAKDIALKDTIVALIRSTKSTVNMD